MDLSKTIIPKSDQLNADDLISGARTIKIRDIKGGASDEQPVMIYFHGDNNKPFKPCKSMRRVLVQLWGTDGLQFIGRRLTIYREETVKWAGVETGGIRISHASHIAEPKRVLLTVARNSRKPVTIDVITPVLIKDFEAVKKAIKEKTKTKDFFIENYDLTPEQLKELQDAN